MRSQLSSPLDDIIDDPASSMYVNGHKMFDCEWECDHHPYALDLDDAYIISVRDNAYVHWLGYPIYVQVSIGLQNKRIVDVLLGYVAVSSRTYSIEFVPFTVVKEATPDDESNYKLKLCHRMWTLRKRYLTYVKVLQALRQLRLCVCQQLALSDEIVTLITCDELFL